MMSARVLAVSAAVLVAIAGLGFYRAYERSHADCGPNCFVVYAEGTPSVSTYLFSGAIVALLAITTAMLAARRRDP
jgi:hypothetical protein